MKEGKAPKGADKPQMVSQAAVAQGMRDYMDSVDGLVMTLATESNIAIDAALSQRFVASGTKGAALEQLWQRMQAQTETGSPADKAAAAITWLQACVQAGLVAWLELHLKSIPRKLSVAHMQTEASRGARRNAATSLNLSAAASFPLLEFMLDSIHTVMSSGSPQQKARSQDFTARLCVRDFMWAVVAAVRCWGGHMNNMRQPETIAALDAGGGYDATDTAIQAAGLGPSSAAVSAKYVHIAGVELTCRLNAGGVGVNGAPGRGASARGGASLPTPVTQLIDAMSATKLLPAAAAAILQCPFVDPSLVPTLPASDRKSNSRAGSGSSGSSSASGGGQGRGTASPKDTSAVCISHAARTLCQALLLLSTAKMRVLLHGGGAAVAPAAATLGEVLGDEEDVGSLRRYVLERMLTHAGVALAREDGIGGGGADSEWWLTRMEAQRGHVVDAEGAGDGSEDWSGQLEDDHCHVAFATLAFWRQQGERSALTPEAQARLPPAPGAPPALALARLAARTGEAVCRLYRGEGLGGTYGPAREWQFARMKALTELLDFSDQVSKAPAAEVRSCLPHWMEAAAWGLAIGVQAAAAELETRGGAGAALARSPLAQKARAGDPVENMLRAFWSLWSLSEGASRLDVAGRQELVRRLRHAGLGAALDAALRLALRAADRAASAAAATSPSAVAAPHGVAAMLTEVPHLIGEILTADALRGVFGGQSLAGGAGLLVTASKRATALACRIEDATAAAAAAQGGAETAAAATVVGLLDPFAKMLAVLSAAVRSLGRQLREQKKAGAEGEAGSLPVDAAAEVLSLAVRSGCHLATQLAAASARAVLAPAAATATATGRGRGAAPAATAQSAVTLVAASVNDFLCRVFRPACQGELGCERLDAEQLLPCQPHRLLAAVAALLAAVSAAADSRSDPHAALNLAQRLVDTTVLLASHEGLSDRLQSWLAPAPTGPNAAAAVAPEAAGGEVRERGCLERPFRDAAVPTTMTLSPPDASFLMALLELAAQAAGGSGGGGGGGRDADVTAFRATALRIGCIVVDSREDKPRMVVDDIKMPDGSPLSALFMREMMAHMGLGRQATAAAAAAVAAAPLPPLLCVPPAFLVPRYVRMCGNPRCTNYGAASEEALGPLLCSACRGVRYCGAACSKAAWQAHKLACKELVAARAAGSQ